VQQSGHPLLQISKTLLDEELDVLTDSGIVAPEIQ
jgi:hypothetical protein